VNAELSAEGAAMSLQELLDKSKDSHTANNADMGAYMAPFSKTHCAP